MQATLRKIVRIFSARGQAFIALEGFTVLVSKNEYFR